MKRGIKMIREKKFCLLLILGLTAFMAALCFGLRPMRTASAQTMDVSVCSAKLYGSRTANGDFMIDILTDTALSGDYLSVSYTVDGASKENAGTVEPGGVTVQGGEDKIPDSFRFFFKPKENLETGFSELVLPKGMQVGDGAVLKEEVILSVPGGGVLTSVSAQYENLLVSTVEEAKVTQMRVTFDAAGDRFLLDVEFDRDLNFSTDNQYVNFSFRDVFINGTEAALLSGCHDDIGRFDGRPPEAGMNVNRTYRYYLSSASLSDKIESIALKAGYTFRIGNLQLKEDITFVPYDSVLTKEYLKSNSVTYVPLGRKLSELDSSLEEAEVLNVSVGGYANDSKKFYLDVKLNRTLSAYEGNYPDLSFTFNGKTSGYVGGDARQGYESYGTAPAVQMNIGDAGADTVRYIFRLNPSEEVLERIKLHAGAIFGGFQIKKDVEYCALSGITPSSEWPVTLVEKTIYETLRPINEATEDTLKAALETDIYGLDLTIYNQLEDTSAIDAVMLETDFHSLTQLGEIFSEEVNKAVDVVLGKISLGALDAVRTNLVLPKSAGGLTLTWESENPSVTASGAVTRPAFGQTDARGNLKVSAGGRNRTFPVTVKALTIESITVVPPTETEYRVGQSLNLAGAKLTVTFDDGTTSKMDVTQEMVSGFDSNVAGTCVVTVTYDGKSANFSVTIIDGNEDSEKPENKGCGGCGDTSGSALLSALMLLAGIGLFLKR